MSSPDLKKKIMEVLKQVRPQIQSHGGDFKLVKIQDGEVVIKILGACLGCGLVDETFGAGLRKMIKSEVPEVKEVKFLT